MRRFIHSALLAIAIISIPGCSSATALDDAESVRGVVTALGSRISISGENGGPIEGWGDTTVGSVNLTAGVPIYREVEGGHRESVRLEAIEVGDVIRVWHFGAEKRSDPPQIDARQIVIVVAGTER